MVITLVKIKAFLKNIKIIGLLILVGLMLIKLHALNVKKILESLIGLMNISSSGLKPIVTEEQRGRSPLEQLLSN